MTILCAAEYLGPPTNRLQASRSHISREVKDRLTSLGECFDHHIEDFFLLSKQELPLQIRTT